VAASRAIECAMLEAFRARQHGNGDHPHLAIGAARTVDRQQFWIGFRGPRHDEK
jgi:hypothetical protein